MKDQYAQIESALRYLQRRAAEQPTLAAVAGHVGLSPHHFQRLFRQWVGISPKRYLEHLTVNRAKGLLREPKSLFEVALELGLSGPSRLHDQFVSLEATSPGQYRDAWQGLEIRYGTTSGPFGEMLIAQTARGVCLLTFVTPTTREPEIDRLQRLYRRAALREDRTAVANTAARIFALPPVNGDRHHLAVRGTNFQVSVWRALLAIPPGAVTSYRQLAASISSPRAARAVASAVAANPVNYLIPCHRVIRSDGGIGGFRGGSELKQRMLALEASSRPSRHSGSAADAT